MSLFWRVMLGWFLTLQVLTDSLHELKFRIMMVDKTVGTSVSYS